jgi:SSS family transporter
MDWIYQHWLAVVLLGLYTAMLLYNAYRGSRASSGLSGFYVGGRNMGGVMIGVSFFATFASTNSYIGHAGKGYAYGLPWMVMALSLVFFTYVSWRLVGPYLRRFASHWDALTIPDYLGSRFVPDDRGRSAHPLRFASAIVIVFSSLLYLIAIFKGAGHLFQQFLGVPYTTAVGITLVIVMLYTSIGGFVSVVRTDVVQGVLMVLGAATILYFVTDAAGGVGAITQLAEQPQTEFLFELNAGIPFLVLMGISLSGSLKLLVDPRQISRFYALKDDRAVRQGVWVAVIGLALVQFCIFPVGVYAHLILTGVTDTDLIVPTLVSDPNVFPLWAADFLIVAIVAAAMSSMDSVLLVAASTLYKNIIEPLRHSRRQLQWTRLAVIGFAVVAAALALNPPGDIVEITIFSGSLYAVCFFPAVVLGLHWWRGSALAVLASMGVGVAVLAIWMLTGLREVVHEVFPALSASLLVYVLLALCTPHVPGVLDKPAKTT